jgi:hypothetical protein
MVAALRSLLSKQTCLHSVERVKKMKNMGVVYLFGMESCQLGFAGAIELSKLRVWGRGSEGERARRNERTRALTLLFVRSSLYTREVRRSKL